MTETSTALLTYDEDGNIIEEKEKATGAFKKYTFSSENRLIKLEKYDNNFTPPVMTAEYSYDIYGRRIKKTVNNEITHFLWEDDNIGLELNGSMQPVRRYVYGVGIDSAEGHFEYSENPTNPFSLDKKGWYSYVKDQVGTIYKTYNHYTQQTATTAYDSFGNTLSQSGSPKGNLGFQSKYKDPESGLYYYYHRYYNPQNGRFLNEDPISLKGGLNLYEFVINNPIALIDPKGTIFNSGRYREGKHHEKRPGTEDEEYNCMAYALGLKTWTPPKNKRTRAAGKPNLIPPKFGCKKTSCSKSCKCGTHKIAIYEDKKTIGEWHVYRQDDGKWSCKYGGGVIGDVIDPTDDYDYIYMPKSLKRTCWCCPTK